MQDMELRRSKRARRSTLPDFYVYLQEPEHDILGKDDPENFKQAIMGEDNERWLAAMKSKLESMRKNGVWELKVLPQGCKPIGCKWVYKTKRDSKGAIDRYKAKLVAKGYTQQEGIDYTKTFSPVSTKDSWRVIMALVAHFDLHLYQMDVKIAFLNGHLKEEIYMQQPEENVLDSCIYVKISRRHYVLLVLYMDDILLASTNLTLLHGVKVFLSKHFEMTDLGEASYVLGIEISRDRKRGLLGLSQKGCIEKILKRFNMMECVGGDVPINKGDKFSREQVTKTDQEKLEMADKPYASLVGSLMYA
ncbi:hypothetical protein L3X38_022488 [Prunus dulcis]|uniref:Reverse transcriptase Ty1/copia-type domain-containing protein n=1 Tax=Prunus dulcis TaxID=3755 RepID=A0AAD4VXQ1_PRUDU|nr:hypothetical protein L3X38_022488 [Prunus dulcis]